MEVLGDLPLSVAYERQAAMARMFGDDVQAMALRNAYAIDDDWLTASEIAERVGRTRQSTENRH
jgi:hypothetical protein